MDVSLETPWRSHWRPHSFVEDPHIFMGDPQILIVDPVFLLDLQ